MKWLIPSMAFRIGVFLFAAGIFYYAITVGVPGPDIPDDLAASDARNSRHTDCLMLSGIAMMGLAIAWLCVLGIFRVIGRAKIRKISNAI